MLRPDDVRFCQKLMRRHGVSYTFATHWFPRHTQEATAVLYAFFRVPDDIVDAAHASENGRREALLTWRELWKDAQHGVDKGHPVLRSAVEIFRKYKIPYGLGDDFLDAMTKDISTTRYQTYTDLEEYMYGSAAVVGIIMSYVIGYKNKATLVKAKALGEAMQLTNFLRDIREDYDDRARIYIPQEDMLRFGVTDRDIREHVMTPGLIALLGFEIERARALYLEAEPGIDELAPEGRFAVRLASRLYAAILTKIEQANYDVFQGRAKTSLFEKIAIAYSVWRTTKNML
jgi:phytoene synthase